MWNLFLTSNEAKWRTLRTIVQGVIGVIVANLTAIVSAWNLEPQTSALIVAVVMAVLSPLMKSLGTDAEDLDDEEDEEGE